MRIAQIYLHISSKCELRQMRQSDTIETKYLDEIKIKNFNKTDSNRGVIAYREVEKIEIISITTDETTLKKDPKPTLTFWEKLLKFCKIICGNRDVIESLYTTAITQSLQEQEIITKSNEVYLRPETEYTPGYILLFGAYCDHNCGVNIQFQEPDLEKNILITSQSLIQTFGTYQKIFVTSHSLVNIHCDENTVNLVPFYAYYYTETPIDKSDKKVKMGNLIKGYMKISNSEVNYTLALQIELITDEYKPLDYSIYEYLYSLTDNNLNTIWEELDDEELMRIRSSNFQEFQRAKFYDKSTQYINDSVV